MSDERHERSEAEQGGAGGGPRAPRLRWLPTRIRSKLIFLHTAFSLALAVALLLALRPPIGDIMYEAEALEATLAVELFLRDSKAFERGVHAEMVVVERGAVERFGLQEKTIQAARAMPGVCAIEKRGSGALRAVRYDEKAGDVVVASVQIPEARAAVNRLYLLVTLALLAVYALIAITLEIFVLPKQVYEPIERLLSADEAVQEGRRDDELIQEPLIPADEFGAIMRSRNQSIAKLRRQERELEAALQQVELSANELRRKNHLLEMARRNLADADRLASLGMMSAGIAHELNTPLAVLKGSVEQIAAAGAKPVSAEQSALMLRVVRRLERLSESLLDFARVRPPLTEPVKLAEVVDEAWTLVRIDRSSAGVELLSSVDPGACVLGDGDRLTQVLVNLLRNAVDAIEGPGTIRVTSERSERDGAAWVSLTIADSGPGIDPSVLPRLFEPFASTRMDSHGTGLGLAVAEGIVREHGGLILARNNPEGGAVFEVMLPERGVPPDGLGAAQDAASGKLTGSSAAGGPMSAVSQS